MSDYFEMTRVVDAMRRRALQQAWDRVIDQATYTLAYKQGMSGPRFQLPAVRYEWDWHLELHPRGGTVTLELSTYGVFDA